MKLLIAIPALNEEASIESVIKDCISAADQIIADTSMDQVDITVVSDGSTDRTVDIARRYDGPIKVIVFENNKGYGAAIQEAWNQSDAQLLGFLDADGTCDPLFFIDLVNAVVDTEADVAIGSRLNPASQMPPIRKFGNRIFALLLSLFSNTYVKDTASGMRVLRRSSLARIAPLPNGLDFTPAMSARAVLAQDLKIVERDMNYVERVGRSKLHLVKDGLRFLKTILHTALLYRPSRPLGIVGLLSILVAASIMLSPTIYYLKYGELQEWMIYRFLAAELFGVAGALLLCVGYIGHRFADLALSRRVDIAAVRRGLLGRFFCARWFWALPILLTACSAALVYASFVTYLMDGAIHQHWSRFIVSTFLLIVALILSVTKLLDYIVELIGDRVNYVEQL